MCHRPDSHTCTSIQRRKRTQCSRSKNRALKKRKHLQLTFSKGEGESHAARWEGLGNGNKHEWVVRFIIQIRIGLPFAPERKKKEAPSSAEEKGFPGIEKGRENLPRQKSLQSKKGTCISLRGGGEESSMRRNRKGEPTGRLGKKLDRRRKRTRSDFRAKRDKGTSGKFHQSRC